MKRSYEDVNLYIWGFRACQHLRSLAPVMNDDDNDGQMILWDLGGLKLHDICLTGEEKPRKNLTQETCPDRGSNPGPLRVRRECYHLSHSGELLDMSSEIQLRKPKLRSRDNALKQGPLYCHLEATSSVNLGNNRDSRQMWSACCNSIPLFRKSDKECCPQVLSSFMTVLCRTLQL